MPKTLKAWIYYVLKYWLPFFLWAIVIYSFSANPTVKTTEIHWEDFILKKTAHLVEYFVFSLLFYRVLINSNVKPKNAFWCTVILAFIYGYSDEFHQSFTPGREPKIRDVLIDTFGSLLFILSYKYILPKSKRLTKLAQVIQLVRN